MKVNNNSLVSDWCYKCLIGKELGESLLEELKPLDPKDIPADFFLQRGLVSCTSALFHQNLVVVRSLAEEYRFFVQARLLSLSSQFRYFGDDPLVFAPEKDNPKQSVANLKRVFLSIFHEGGENIYCDNGNEGDRTDFDLVETDALFILGQALGVVDLPIPSKFRRVLREDVLFYRILINKFDPPTDLKPPVDEFKAVSEEDVYKIFEKFLHPATE